VFEGSGRDFEIYSSINAVYDENYFYEKRVFE